ncbi:MAG: hypothetical protein PHO12_08965 [Bacteroidales bacterium]|nr:hypothetical protein [Bacteroidales bacterium]MDD4685161.1 hypothetical protein [Bacteroidales bacterium]
MKLKEQVLSLSQLSELYKLGFDAVDNSSMCWIKHPDNDKIGLTIFIKELFDKNEIGCIPTLSIGDIIDVLPVQIEEKVLNIFTFGETWSVGWEGIQYYGSNTLIDALFETLKWCIKQKHIAL